MHVTVKINPNRLTNNALPFNFFSVTDAIRLSLLVLTSNQEFGRDIETSFLIPKMNTITIKIMEVDDVDESIVDLDSHTNNISK